MINFYGVADVVDVKPVKSKAPYILVSVIDNTETKIVLKTPYSFNKITKCGNRIIFEGSLNEDGIVEVKSIARAYLEPIGFNFVSNNEDIFSFSNKGLFLKVDVKAPNHSYTYKTFEFLAKAGNMVVLERLLGVLKEKKVSLKGIFKNNMGLITSIERS